MHSIPSVVELSRMADIARVLARYGFGDLVQRLGLGRAGGASAAHRRMSSAERVRMALQDLGPAYVKLGQILATRVDLFAPEWIAEFEKLQDRAPASPAEAVRAQFVEDFGAPPEEVFGAFEPQPIAAGSIAQVHRALLPDGTPVAIKLRRPGIRETVEADLRLLERLAVSAERLLPELARFRPREVVAQFARTLRQELDLAVEGRCAERIARSLADHPAIVVPRIYWQWSGERVNVQDYVDGLAGRDAAALDASGLDRRSLAKSGARAMLKMVLEDGFFHADPHPGNLLYLDGNRIAFIDFGMVGRLSERRRDELVRLLQGLVSRDAEDVAELLLDWAGLPGADTGGLTTEVDSFIDRYHGVPLGELRMGAMLTDLVALLRDQRLALPPDLALVLKACVTLEATGHTLDEDFDLVAEAAPFLEAAAAARVAPRALADRGWRSARMALELLADLPRDLRALMRSARSGRLQVHVDVGHLDQVGRQLDHAVNRLAVGIVTAALIIGSSIVMTIEGNTTLLGLPSLGLLGFLGAIGGAAWLAVSIRRAP